MERNNMDHTVGEALADFLLRPPEGNRARIQKVQLRGNHVSTYTH